LKASIPYNIQNHVQNGLLLEKTKKNKRKKKSHHYQSSHEVLMSAWFLG
jgi:hypothetical protein